MRLVKIEDKYINIDKIIWIYDTPNIPYYESRNLKTVVEMEFENLVEFKASKDEIVKIINKENIVEVLDKYQSLKFELGSV